MKLHCVARGAATDDLAGMVLCHDVDVDGRRLRKGHVIAAGDLAALHAAEWDELHLIEPEPGDVHEDEGGRRLASAAAGDGVEVRDASAGHWPLVATRRGILDVSVDALRHANGMDGVLVYTLFTGQIVDAGEHVGRAKVAPLVLERHSVEEAERVARATPEGGLVRVRPFAARRVGAVVQESLGTSGAARFRAALGEKVAWFGSTLLEPAFAASDGDALAGAMQRLVGDGAELLVVAGTRAMDPLDASWLALRRLGVSVERFGVPAHPGSMFWIAWHEALPILGMPTCGLFAQATVFDLVLPRVLAGERVGRAELAALGHGGFLTRELAFRFPPYRGSGTTRGAVAEETAP
jgi:hypothetical protein